MRGTERPRGALLATLRLFWQTGKGPTSVLAAIIVAGGIASVIFKLAVGAVVEAGAALDGRRIGAVAVYAQASLGLSALGFAGDPQNRLREGSVMVRRTFDLPQAIRHDRAELAGHRDADSLPAHGIRLESVRFSYPRTSRTILDGLDLEIPAGRSLAVVGVNGAGKTTLVKLLARLYDPDAGRITVDGIDLREIDPRAWRSRIAAVFQDFMRFELSARDNVGFGSPLRHHEAILAEAARQAGAEKIVARLESGWDTPLSRGYPGGTDLSGGEWQRVALARALLAVQAGARVLVLDEPTANLDVRAEAELFDRFLDITRGLTTVLISHRFSTVRRADAIAVIDGGRVQELGTHAELIAYDGDYARMFQLQAERFDA